MQEYRKKQGRRAEASEEGLGSKWAVVPIIVVVIFIGIPNSMRVLYKTSRLTEL